MEKPQKTEYETTIPEVKRTLALADKDKTILLEGKNKIIIICSIPKKHAELLLPKVNVE